MTKSQVEAIRGLRNPADPKHAALPKKRVKAPAEAVKEAEVAVITTSWSAAEAAIKSLGNLRGQLGDPALRGRAIPIDSNHGRWLERGSDQFMPIV